MALKNHPNLRFSFVFLSIFLSPLSALAQSHIQKYPDQVIVRLSPFSPFALPYRDDTGLLVPMPAGWTFYSPSPGEGTVPLIICQEGKLQVSNDELSFTEAILVDILDCPSPMRLEDLIEANLEEIRTRSPRIKIGTKKINQSIYGFRFITLSVSEEESNLQLFLAFARAGEKVIKIELLSNPHTYRDHLDTFFYILRVTLPIRIGFYEQLLQVQAGAILTPAEINLRQKLLGEGPYDYWIRYGPGTEVQFRQTQKFPGHQLQFEKSFNLISADKEGVAIKYVEKGVSLPGQKASAFPIITGEKLLEFIRFEEMFSSKDPFDSNLGLDLNFFLTHTNAVVVAEGKAKIPVQNNLLETEWASYSILDSQQPRRLTIWFSENVPGRIVRLVQENPGETGFSQEIQLTSFSVKKPSAEELEALKLTPEGTVEVNAISYVQKRLKVMENRISPFYHMVGTTCLFNVLSRYYADRAVQPEEMKNLLRPMMEEAANIKSEFETFFKTVNDELSPEELKKIDSFITTYKNYLNSSARKIELFLESLDHYDPKDKTKSEEFSKSVRAFFMTVAGVVNAINQIDSQFKSLAATKLKVTLKKS